MSINTKQLRVFVTICKCGSFTKAAEVLYMTQQAVSYSVSALERSLDCTLFYRNVGNVELTEDGSFLYKNCSALLREENLLQYKLAHRFDNSDIVRVGYGFGMLRNLPHNLFGLFQSKFPHYHLIGTEMLNLTCENQVEADELDVAFTIGPVDETRFSSYTLFRDIFVGIMENNSPLAHKALLNINDLQGQGIICNSGKNRNSLVAYCEKAGFRPNIVHCCTDLISQMYLCSNSSNVVVTVDQLLDNMFLQYPTLRKIPFDDSFYPWEMCLITKKGRKPSRAVNVFVNFVLEHCLDE